ncbi:hypothetical protein Acsp03_01860 [Actinomadura sp. NBRC 104412]|nr:hypothetical protein Acsp03_01860 [Actinomadura sp. NBRC 104412]
MRLRSTDAITCASRGWRSWLLAVVGPFPNVLCEPDELFRPRIDKHHIYQSNNRAHCEDSA